MAAAATLVAASSSYQDDVLSSSSLSFSSVYAEISACKSEFRIPTHMLQNDSYNDDTIRDYIWENYQNQLKQSITIQVSVDQLATKRANNRLKLLDKISQVQRQYLLNEEPTIVFGGLLDCLLEMMDSEYGMIGELKFDDDDERSPYLLTHAVTNIAWNDFTRKFYEDNIATGLKFRNMNTLFGTVLTTGETVIANDPKTHPNAAGIPDGHPPLTHFLGIPFFVQGGTQLSGMVGIANKPGGYTQEDVDFLEPLVVTCSNLIQAYNTNRENGFLFNKLEDLVVLRTNELQLANQKVVEAAKTQIEHFACMSHEIRTPLNCVIGLSSLLQETELDAFQKDSLQMIVKSGELLMAVVNDVLDYSKLQTDNMTMEIQETSLQETLDAVVHSIECKAKDKRLKFKTFYDSAVPDVVQTDSRRLQQILYNLLGNAIKFSREDGSVEFSVVLCRSNATDDADNDGSYNASFIQLHRGNIDHPNNIANPISEPNFDCKTSRSSSPLESGCGMSSIGELDTSIHLGLGNEIHHAVNTTTKFGIRESWLFRQHVTAASHFNRFASGPNHWNLPNRNQISNDESNTSDVDTVTTTDNEISCNGESMNSLSFAHFSQSALFASCKSTDNNHQVYERKQHVPQQPISRCPFAKAPQSSSSISPSNHSIVNIYNVVAQDADTSSDSESVVSLCPFSKSSNSKNSNLESGGNHKVDHDIAVAYELEPKEIMRLSPQPLKGEGNTHVIGESKDVESSDFRLRFVVKDYGKGIATKDFEKIFQPFQQANSDSTNVHEGTGLGLAITSRLIKGLGGVIHVESELGQWSQFTLELPLQGKPFNVPKIMGKLHNIRILLVKKNTAQKSLFEKIIQEQDMELVIVNDCNKLLDLVNGRNCKTMDTNHVNVCIIEEHLYNSDSYHKLSNVSKTVLMTFGPKYQVKRSNWHFRSLYRTLPAVILTEMVRCVKDVIISPKKTVTRNAIRDGKLLKVNGAIESPIATKIPRSYDKINVMIAEDNVVNQKVLSQMLKRIGLKNIDVVDDGKKAVDQSATKKYDIILMDMQMPIMGGVEASRIITERRKRDRTELPHIVFVTAHTTSEFESLAMDAGGSGFISKPFSLQVIRSFFDALPSYLFR